MLFRKGRENKVSVWHGQKAQMSLRPLSHAPPPHSTVTNRNPRLDYLEASPSRVSFRIDKTGQPVFLVRLKEMITDRQRYQEHHSNDGQILPAQSGNNNAGHKDR